MKKKNKKNITVVLDTNILISGLFTNSGTIAALMNLWVAGEFTIAISEEILSELYKTLHKPSIQKYFKISEDAIVEYIDMVKHNAYITPNLYTLDIITKDPSDNKFLVCAMESKAAYIVSGDKHLKELKEFNRIKIVDAKTFLGQIKKINGS